MHLTPFTPESAKLAQKRSIRARLAKKALNEAIAQLPNGNVNAAHKRSSRLWLMLEKIDNRIAAAVRRSKLDEAAKLAAIAKVVRGQIDNESRGAAPRVKAAAASAPPLPDLP